MTFCLFLAASCSREDGIRQYTVAREESAAPVTMAAPPVSSGNMAWFVKLTGPEGDVKDALESFSQIVETLKFDESGTPSYDLPEGWESSDGPPPRYQTITKSGSDPTLEITLSALPAGAATDEYLLANINRWRGQLGLDAMSGDNWKETAEQAGEVRVASAANQTVAMVHLTGTTNDYGDSRMLGAIVLPQGDSAAMSPPPSRPSGGAPSPKLTYDVPEGWQVAPGNSMRLASFQAGEMESPVDISVIRLAGGGDVLGNINRWRGQVKMDPLSEETLKESVETINIDGKEAVYSDILGEETSILAAILEDGEAKWFFKAMGPTDAIVAEQENFKAFLASVKFAEE
ncbi:MAG: hypothetical protein KDA80_16425 [Planctomycetaceae bacterium]|nr:hypothetical protein [Planctomycetaceae bacterium]